MMRAPDWYPEWRHEAVHELIEKNTALSKLYKTESWPRYDYDLENRALIFSDEGGPKVRAEVQVIGTTGRTDWLWSWANAHWTAELTQDAGQARAFGEQQGIEELVTASLADDNLNGLGWACTAVAARLLDAPGAYRPEGLYLLYRNIDWIA